MSAISVRDVWVEYGDQIVLERINLEIESGTFLSVVGPSGAGKSTFLRLVLGQEQPSRGTILLDGAPLSPTSPVRIAASSSSAIPCFPHLTVLRNVHGRLRASRRSKALARLRGPARADAIQEERGACWTRSASAPTATNTRALCPAACSSASRLPRPLRDDRAYCCSTSHLVRSILERAHRCTH